MKAPFAMFLRPVSLPRLPTGPAVVRFMKSATAANVPLIAVLGGLGHLGSCVVAHMLKKGYYVRAIVPQAASTDFLLRLPGAQTRLQVISVRDPAAEDARSTLLNAFRGVSTVIHAATFSTHSGKIPKHMAARRIVSALKIALDAASTPGNVVTNFIYISSEMAVFDPSQHSRRKTVHLSEQDWYDCSHQSRELTHPFSFAHTVAEMRLWARVGRSGLPFNVCSVIPSFIIGPVLSKHHIVNTPPIAFFADVAGGKLHVIPDIPVSPVDVRDVTHAIGSLVERPDISGRILLSAESLTSTEMFVRAEKEFPNHSWPKLTRRRIIQYRPIRGEPAAVHAFKMAEFSSKERRGYKYSFSQKRAHEELGLTFRPVSETIRDTMLDLYRYNMLKLPNWVRTHREHSKPRCH